MRPNIIKFAIPAEKRKLSDILLERRMSPWCKGDECMTDTYTTFVYHEDCPGRFNSLDDNQWICICECHEVRHERAS